MAAGEFLAAAGYLFISKHESVQGARNGPRRNAASVVGSSPRHETTGQSSLDISRKLRLDLIYRYVSVLPAVTAPAYSTGDARAAWRVNSHVEFSVAGRNLFRPNQVEYAADPGGPVAIRRSVFATLSWVK